MINLISIIFNNCLRLCYFPETWKIAKILPIRKPNKLPTKLTSYRPISLLPCLGKLFEKVFNQWLQFEINRQAVIPDIQFGFRPLHSTVHAALTLTEDVIQGLIKTDNTIACFLDAEKAFDTVWTNGLIWKMIFKFKIDDSLCLLTYNYLNNRQFYVMANNKSSSTFNIAAGVPQGAIISPNLYSIFTADIPLNQCSLIKTIQYADDTVIYMSSKSLTHANLELNNHLNMLNDYYKLWKIKLNIEKCETIIFRNPSPICGKNILAREKEIAIKIGNTKIKNTKKVKYLGIFMSNLLKNYIHVKHTLKKAYTAKHFLYPILNVDSGVSNKIKIMCYKQLIRPQLTYGFPLWFNISPAQMNQLKIFETKCLRQCISFKRTPTNFKFISNKSLYEKTKIMPIDEYNYTLMQKFMNQLENIPNSNIELLSNRYINYNHTYNSYFEECTSTNKYMPPTALKHLLENSKIYNTNNEFIMYKK